MICVSCRNSLGNDQTTCPACGGTPALAGRYQLVHVTSEGPGGTVYRAVGIEDGETYAIRQLLDRDVQSPEHAARFAAGVETLESLEHPGLPRHVDHFETGEGDDHGRYVVEEFVWGNSLAKEMRRKRYTAAELLKILVDALEVLEYLHGRMPRIFVRDIRPEKLLRRRRDGHIVLVGLGTAVRQGQGPVGGFAGAPGYAAPELADEARDIGPEADIYALGATALALLARRPITELLLDGDELRWRYLVELPELFELLLVDMLQPDPGRRVSNAGLLKQRAKALLATRSPELDEIPEVLSEDAEAPAGFADAEPVEADSEPAEPEDAGEGVTGKDPKLSLAEVEEAFFGRNSGSDGPAWAAGRHVSRRGPVPVDVARETMAPTRSELKRRKRGGWLAVAGGAATVFIPFVYEGTPAFFLGIGAAILGIHLMVSSTNRVRLIRRAWEEGKSTIGRVVEVYQEPETRRWTVVYRYEVRGHSFDGRSHTTEDHAKQVRPEAEVEVLYLAHDPTISVINPLA